MAVVTAKESDEYASRQIASFLRIPTEGGPFKSIPPTQKYFSMACLTEASPSMKWKNRDIYDVHGNLLFRDKSWALSEAGHELRIRTAASDELRAPVWTVSAGPAIDYSLLTKAAKRKAAAVGLKPIGGKKELVCYSYPKLGILCDGKRGRVVIDLGDATEIFLEERKEIVTEESRFCWSPFELVTAPTLPRLKSVWNRIKTSMQEIPANTATGLTEAVRSSREGGVSERTLGNMSQIGQIHEMACAPASFEMILKYHGFSSLTQSDIATAMGTTQSDGTDPARQSPAVTQLTNGTRIGILDPTPLFSEAKAEIENLRYPLKEGITGHARVVAGWKVEASGELWEYIFDPWPVGVGSQYWEKFDAVDRYNYIYVRPPVFH